MRELSLEKVCFIIAKSREVDAKVDIGGEVDPSNPVDDDEIDVLAAASGAEEEELVGAIEELNDDEQAELVALALVGREDFSKEEWDDAIEEAANVAGNNAVGYLVGMPLLGDYLESGLSSFGLDCTSLEEQNVAPPAEEP